jgi:hypothetical protein
MISKAMQFVFLQVIFVGAVLAQNPPVKAVLSDIPTQASMDAFKQKGDEINSYIANVCADEKFKTFFLKTPCNVRDITLQHLTDSSSATPAEKKIILLIDVEYLNISKMIVDNNRQNVKPESLGNQLASIRIKSRSDIQNNLSNLYQGKITWGAYNTQRKALAAADSEAMNQAVKEHRPSQ